MLIAHSVHFYALRLSQKCYAKVCHKRDAHANSHSHIHIYVRVYFILTVLAIKIEATNLSKKGRFYDTNKTFIVPAPKTKRDGKKTPK